MFSKIPKEKDESDNEAETTVSNEAAKPDFDLDNLLNDNASVSSFRSSSSALYRGNHRRRRPTTGTPLKGMEEDGSDSTTKYHGHNRYNNNKNQLVKLLAHNFWPKFFVLFLLVFWGPMLLRSMLQKNHPRDGIDALPSRNLRNRQNPEPKKIVDDVVEEEQRKNSEPSPPEESDEKKQGLNDSVLAALRAEQNNEFQLPEREEEQFEDENEIGKLSEEEQEELQIPINVANKWEQEGEDSEERIQREHPQRRIQHDKDLPEITSIYKRAEKPELIPDHFGDSFANVWEPILPTDIPLFWHIPKNGGTTVGDIFTHCVNLVTASSIGATEGHGNEDELKVRTYHDQGKYVNVDTASLGGIERAKKLGLAASGLADVVELHRLHEGSVLFDPNHRARLFAMFRNPVHRAISMFYYLQKANWEPTYDPSLKDMTLLDYANSKKVEENWVTRFLIHQYTGPLLDEHVEAAKQVMRDKMIVGILDDRTHDSLKRFELYFDWWEFNKKKGHVGRMVTCQENHARTAKNKVQHSLPDKNDPAYQRLLQLNWADMKLFRYAEQLFHEQEVFVKLKDASIEDE